MFKKRCVICHRRDRKDSMLQYVRYYAYDAKKYYFHGYCVKAVLNNPERHSHKVVDTACAVVEEIQRKEAMCVREEEKTSELVRTLQKVADSLI